MWASLVSRDERVSPKHTGNALSRNWLSRAVSLKKRPPLMSINVPLMNFAVHLERDASEAGPQTVRSVIKAGVARTWLARIKFLKSKSRRGFIEAKAALRHSSTALASLWGVETAVLQRFRVTLVLLQFRRGGLGRRGSVWS